MHPHPHIHAAMARDAQARRIAEARRASIGVPRQRQLTSTRETPAQGLFARLADVVQRSAA